MVSFRRELPRLANGEPDLDVWLDQASGFSLDSRARAERVLGLVTGAARQPGLELMELLLELNADVATVMAGVAFFGVQSGAIGLHQLPAEAATLVASVQRLSATDVLACADSAILGNGSASQADNVRRMLIALIDDPRVAVIKLAERVVVLRHAKSEAPDARRRTAQEAMQFFAPLAERLGIWQAKWALEDLAFSYLHTDEYRQIAEQLDGRREQRERHVEAIRQDLEFRLATAKVQATVTGRAKHIYSIWQKMGEKSLEFSEVYDVQALRVLVDNIESCYRALGVVHTSWPHITWAFDDYIANPKENGYRSIHTAVIGPTGKTLEVQIRTWAMHEEAELGVCAHWAYKDGTDAQSEGALTAKAEWLRSSVLDWHEFGPQAAQERTISDRIFVRTPEGHVLDLPFHSTPVDFAYRVHTEVGHRCVGARVDGQRVPLDKRLSTGECVEIETSDVEAPQRRWLEPELGFVHTSRARAKIKSWFRSRLADSNENAGRNLLEEAAGDRKLDLARLAEEAGCSDEGTLLRAVGVGDLVAADIARLLRRHFGAELATDAASTDVEAHDARLQSGLVLRCHNRDGLLRDITAATTELGISLVAVQARTEAGEIANISLQLLAEEHRLAAAIGTIRRIPDVLDVRRDASSPAAAGPGSF